MQGTETKKIQLHGTTPLLIILQDIKYKKTSIHLENQIRKRKDKQNTINPQTEIEHSYQPQTIIIIMSPSINQFLVCTAYLLSLCAALVWTQDCHCGLPGTIVKFKSCKKKPAAWRSHDHPDINLTGSCLPEVPVK